MKRWTHDFCLFALVTHRSLLRACVHGARDSQVTDALVLCDDVTGERMTLIGHMFKSTGNTIASATFDWSTLYSQKHLAGLSV